MKVFKVKKDVSSFKMITHHYKQHPCTNIPMQVYLVFTEKETHVN
jgi:hypothetical protein